MTLWAAALVPLLAANPAAAEGNVRIVDQFGLTSLLWHVARAEGFIQKQGRAQGLEIAVEWSRLSGGSAVNEALLSGAVDVAHIGVGPTLLLWDRTLGKQNFKAFAAVGTMPQYLLSNRADVKSIRDLGGKDRIAVVSTSSQQARTLQMAAAQTFGFEQFARFDNLLVTLPHTEAMAVLASGKGGVTAHFSNAPFQYQQRKTPGLHVILSSYDVMGGPSSSVLAVTSEKFRRDNPKTYAAVKAALADAAQLVRVNKRRAAEIYLEAEDSKVPLADILAFLDDPEIGYDVVPQNTERLARFLHKAKVLKNDPATWKSYFFDDVHQVPGG
ncbi:MetQ/NlpA family ABC transporter substrate-binding protein [Variovorax sp. J22P240]|uniref:ABC transporter substrate-binding protein n=1 Tax=Variovorax sp. J22P240 TaxID=3053514 RepID=UPI0025768820|nr:ABC transporter substrate-binding protein [Variovorax sp. J22P240]MDM0001916.1 MetQ/NlpA family ABC transporter substrate-binding protein [Variovorax sp. J22P240]